MKWLPWTHHRIMYRHGGWRVRDGTMYDGSYSDSVMGSYRELQEDEKRDSDPCIDLGRKDSTTHNVDNGTSPAGNFQATNQ